MGFSIRAHNLPGVCSKLGMIVLKWGFSIRAHNLPVVYGENLVRDWLKRGVYCMGTIEDLNACVKSASLINS